MMTEHDDVGLPQTETTDQYGRVVSVNGVPVRKPAQDNTCIDCGGLIRTRDPRKVHHDRCALCGECLDTGHYCGEGEDTLGEGTFLPEVEPRGGYY